MEITSQILIDAIEGTLSEPELSCLVGQLRDLSPSEILQVARQAGINVTGDGIVIGNNNFNIVIKDDHPRVISDAFKRSHALYQLRAPVGDFVGRGVEIEQLKTSLRGNVNNVISGVSGMGGIGKTELSLYAANQLKEDYPDGQLMVSMRGTDEKPREPIDALAECVRAFVGLEAKLPENITDLSNLYLSLLSGKRALLFFDNAADGAQISPLRPPAGCGMLVTSRSPIALPGIENIRLGELVLKDARELLSLIVDPIDPSVADTICELCGYLPLAIRAAGSLLAITADLDPYDFANQLRNERTRLERLGAEGVDISVRASFNRSYARLSPKSAAVFGQLAAFYSSFDSAAEEAVCEDEGHKHLSNLVQRSLVQYDKETKRYRLHELMRVFAQSFLNDEEHSTAKIAFAHHYLKVIEQANKLYLQSGQAHSQGLEIVNREGENIRHGWAWASAQAENNEKAAQICWSYTSWGSNLLLRRFPATELKVWCQRSISIAKQLNNREAELGPLTLLGLVHESIGEYNSAQELFQQALDLAEELEDYRSAAIVFEHLGRALADKGRMYEAIENYEHAKRLWCSLGEHEREGKAVSNIALAYSALRETDLAIKYLQQVLDNARKDKNRLDEANALGNLANVYSKRSKTQAIHLEEQAAHLEEQAAEIFQELGYRHWEASALSNSGLWLVENGDSMRGIQQIQQALATLRDIGDRHGEVLAVGNLGEAYMILNDSHMAIRAFDEQLRLAREIGDRHREANALGDKGILLVQVEEPGSAILILNEARRIDQVTGNHNHEFKILCHIGKAYAKAGKRAEAIKAFEDQINVARSMGVVSNELHALKHIADLHAELGNNKRAKEYMGIRVKISQTSKDPHDHPDTLLELAEFLAGIGNYNQAVSQAEDAIPLFEKIPDPSCAMKVRHQINEWNNSTS